MDKKKELYKWGTILIGMLVMCWAIAPFIMRAVGGLLGGALALGIGAIVIAFLPVAAEALTAWKFKALKAVVSKAPVEALYKKLQARREHRELVREKLEKQSIALAVFRRKSLKMIKDYPEEREEREAEVRKFENLMALRLDQYKELFTKVEDFAKFVEKQERRYEMSLATIEAGGVMELDKDFTAELAEKFAIDEIDRTVDSAFSQMEMSLVDEQVILDNARRNNQQIHVINYDNNGNVVTGNILAQNRHELERA